MMASLIELSKTLIEIQYSFITKFNLLSIIINLLKITF